MTKGEWSHKIHVINILIVEKKVNDIIVYLLQMIVFC